MKELLSLILSIISVAASAQLQPSDVRINDSLGIFETGRTQQYEAKRDSSNSLKVDCGISDYFDGNYFTLNYVNGVCYLTNGDSMALFLVDFKNTKNKVVIRKLKLKSGLSLKRFERQIKRCQCKNTREEVERTKGMKEIAYTVYKDETGLAYRAYFRNGQLHTLLMYIPCN